MLRIISLSAIALAALLVVPINATAGGSEAFRLSTYTCSDVYWGETKVGDNCVAKDEEKLEVMDTYDNDDNDDDD